MKLKSLLSCVFSAILLSSTSACTVGKSTLLAKPIEVKALSYEESREDNFLSFKDKSNEFSAKLSSAVYQAQSGNKNFVLSPISVFFALSLASQCADGDTRAELLSALGVTYEQLNENIPKLYRSLENTYTTENILGTEKITGQLSLTNSIWIGEQAHVKQECLDILASNYYCYSYSANFFSDNKAANQAVRDFVKKQTKKKIDRDFQLSPETLFTLINTLYLKDVWNTDGDELPKTSPYTFTNADGTTISKKLLQGYYTLGKVQQAEGYSFFYTTTHHGYKIHFILPDDTHTVEQIFTEKTLNDVKAVTDYQGVDEENEVEYLTRCLFPEYKADFYEDIKPTLKDSFGISDFFTPDKCNFSTLSNDSLVCDKVVHSATLEVDARGIEGAAVTVLAMEGTSAQPYEKIYADFVIDRAFAFTISDWQNVTLFSGVVNKI